MKLLAIDGNSIMNRAFYAIKGLSNSRGVFTNAITGFMNIYLREYDILKPDCVVVAFDLKAPTFRHEKVESYKANRKGMPDELRSQMPVIKEILKAMGAVIVEKEGYEADDILGTLARMFSESKNENYILTGDRDSFQLVCDYTTVRLATNKETIVYNTQKIREVYELEPKQMIEVKALMGDSSDNIPGVPGIGEKTALKLIKENASVEELYNNLDKLKLTPSVRTKLESGHESAKISKWLGTIEIHVPIDEDIDAYKLMPIDIKKVTEILSDLEMYKLLERITGKANENRENETESDVDKKEYIVKELFSTDIESFVEKKVITYFIFANNVLKVAYSDLIYITEDEKLIKQYFESKSEKSTFECKGAYKYAMIKGCELNGVFFMCDLAGYLLNSMLSEYTVKILCNTYKAVYHEAMGENAEIASLEELCEKLKQEVVAADMLSLLEDVEQPLCKVIASMEIYGVKADINGIKTFGDKLKIDINNLENQIYALAGEKFNIGSPKQLGVVLFENLGLPAKKKTKTGYSTNSDVLESLMGKHAIIPLIVEYRTLSKLNSTYVEGLLKCVADDGRVHSVFKQTETRTGRISSTEPNMQNIPVRKEIGRNMRKFFIAEDGYVLLDADYSQIELRVLAHACADENMKRAFIEKKDIHTTTAAQVFGVPEDFVTSEMRSAAKAVNFGIVYGIGAFSLSQDIGVSVKEAEKYIKQYLANYPNVQEFMNKTVEDGKQNGYVTTLFGRRRYIPELLSSNKILQAFGKRAAMNAPIQGAAADIIKIAMIKASNKFFEEKLDARLILQVHDELIVEASVKDKDRAAKILHDEMENAVNLSVPMIADVNEGESWYAAKG